jgi:hypothetical protein
MGRLGGAAGAAGPAVFARGMEARQGRDAQRLDAKHDSPTPRSRDAPNCIEPAIGKGSGVTNMRIGAA